MARGGPLTLRRGMGKILGAVYDLLSPAERRRAGGILVLMLAAAGFELIGIGSVLPFLRMAMDPDIVRQNREIGRAHV